MNRIEQLNTDISISVKSDEDLKNQEKQATEEDFEILANKKTQEIIFRPKQQHKYTLIWLHGLGDTAAGWYPIFASDYCPVTVNTKIILPTAPLRPLEINGGGTSPAWYDFKLKALESNSFTNPDDIADQKQLQEVNDYFLKVIKEEVKLLDGDYSKIFIGGFSQGGSMALHIGLSNNLKLGGVFSTSGLLLNRTKFTQPMNIGLMHGQQDMVLPQGFAWHTYKRLFEDVEFNQKNKENNKYLVTYIEEKIGHEVNVPVLEKLREWFIKFIQSNNNINTSKN